MRTPKRILSFPDRQALENHQKSAMANTIETDIWQPTYLDATQTVFEGLLKREILGPNFQNIKPKTILKLKTIIIIFFMTELYSPQAL